jgi:hypothetical protein
MSVHDLRTHFLQQNRFSQSGFCVSSSIGIAADVAGRCLETIAAFSLDKSVDLNGLVHDHAIKNG